MSGFEPRWLELREPADKRARAASAIEAMLRIDVAEAPMRILDLGAGTGANLRFLAPRLGGRQEWLLVDADRRLLDAAAPAMEAWAARTGCSLRRGTESTSIESPGFQCGVRVLQLDMAARLTELPIEGQRLVTASALLDLVSESWAERLLRRCRAAGTDVLFALTYDGRIAFEPVLSDDPLVLDLVNRHQRSDKGFGPAMGPSASDRIHAMLVGHGYRVESCSSDWRIDADEAGLQTELIEGLAAAAAAMEPDSEARLSAWCRRRLEFMKLGISRVTVGHQDLLGRVGQCVENRGAACCRSLFLAETPSFTRLWQDYWTEDERGEFCAWISANPEAGDVVPGTGGVRKVRWSRAGSGKRGGVRVVYYNQLSKGRAWLLLIYAKSARENLPAHVLSAAREMLEDAKE